MNLFLLIKNFSKAKWVFSRPKNRKYLIYDSGHSNYLFQYIKKRECEIYYTRWEEINLFVLCLVVLNHGLVNLHTNYKKFFFYYVKPKIVITMMSGYTAFYELKKQFPKIITIAIQNDLGNENLIKTFRKAKKGTFSCDYFLFFSETFKNLYQKYITIKKKSLVIGSFRNNHYTYKNTSNKKILFISKTNKGQTSLNEIILLKLIIRYLKKNKAGKIDICLKTNDISIIEFYKKSLDIDYINIIPKKNNYLLIKNYENIIFTDSTLGYECLGRGKKIISLALGSLKRQWCVDNDLSPIVKFGYPCRLNNDGFCWSNKSGEKKINQLLKNILFMNQSIFDKKIYKIKKKIMFFDPNNTKFKKLLISKELQNND